MPLLQGLIFDLDGTLLNSAPDLRQALNQTLRSHGRGDVSVEQVQHMIGDGMLPMLSRAFASTGAPISDDETYKMFQEFLVHYRDQKPDPAQIYPGGVEMLEQFQKAGIKLGICTNKHEGSTIRLLDGLGLTRYFTFIAGGDTFPVHKPHPDHVRGVIKELGVPAEGCVMIGDSRNDVLAAKGAGIPCLVVTHGYGEDYSHLGAERLIPGFKELPVALEALGFNVVKG